MCLKKISLGVVLTLLVLASCKKTAKGNVVATVDGINITAQEIEIQVPEGFKGDQRVRDEILKQYMNEILLYKAAIDEGLMKNEDLKAQINVTKVKVVSQYYLNEKLSGVQVSEEELNRELQATRPYFAQKVDMVVLYYSDSSKTAQYRALLLNTYPTIVSEVNKLNPQEVQVAPLSENLGVIYYSYGKELFDIISSLKIGEISNPIPLASSGYFALIKVLSTSRDAVKEDEIKQFLNRTLVTLRQNTTRDSIITALQNKYKVTEVTGK